MDKKVAALHISDLHIADGIYQNSKISKFQSNKSYLEVLIQELQNIEQRDNIDIQYLLVTGDLTQTADEDEFEEAGKILNELCEKIGISKENVMIVPGNHDINWVLFKDRLKKKGIKDPKEFHKYHEEKFVEFKKFYDGFFDQKKVFTPENAISDIIIAKQLGVAFVGMNSVQHESQLKEDHYGYIFTDLLKRDLNDHVKNISKNECIAVFHHAPIGIGRENNTIENWDDVEAFLRGKGINKYICGHSHTSLAKTEQTKQGDQTYIATGSIGLDDKEINNTFLLLKNGEDERNNKGLEPVYYKWESERGERGYWQKLSDKKDSLSFITINSKSGMNALKDMVKQVSTKPKEVEDSPLDNQLQNDNSEYETEIKNYLIEAIKANNLYISGHFHWSKYGRSHSFIKTNFLFENYECVEKIKLCYWNLINREKIVPDLMLGYSMQGNVIGTMLAVETGWKYSYYPAWGKKYSEYEKILPEGNFSSVMVIIDLVYTNNIVKWLVKKIKKKYEQIKEIIFCTLFYTNTEEFDLKEYEGIKIRFYYVYQLSINTCPYKNKNECPIYMEKLEQIHVLYSEEEEE